MALIVMADDGIAFDGRAKDERPLGGAETAFAELAEALAARGHQVEAFSRCAARSLWKGVSWVPLAEGVPRKADLYIANRSWRLIAECPEARRAVFWIHNPASYLLKWRYQWRLWRRRPVVIFLGPDHLGTYPSWACDGGRVVIPYGITPAFLDAAERKVAPPPRAVFLSNPMRGLDWLLEVWAARIAPNVPGAEFHVFGGAAVYGAAGDAKASGMSRVFDRARELSGAGVVLRGPLGKSELAAEIAGARAFLYRGDLGETFCNAAAETQAMGVPGVVEDIACMKERIRDGETGFVAAGDAAFAEASIRLLRDDTLWLSMHRACLDLQRGRGWPQAAAEWEALIPVS